jgi:hypothetical protein
MRLRVRWQLKFRSMDTAERPCSYCGISEHRVFSNQVKSLRQFGAIALLLLSGFGPAMACMAPNAQMTTQERACCRMMKNQCGQMEMPASSNCCTKAPADDRNNALKTDTASSHPAAFAAIRVSSFELLTPQSAGNGWVQRPEHSPPKSPPSAIAILRI